MRKVINGKGQDTTNTVLDFLARGYELRLATLYLIGEPEDPNAFWLTDYDSPLTWSWMGKFYPDVIKRGSVKSQIGLEVQALDVNWSPSNKLLTTNINFTSPYQKSWLGLLDGATFQSWTAYMQAPGDADSLGASELFGGRIGKITIESGRIALTVNSFLDVVNQMVPGAVIESTNIAAGYQGAVPPAGSVSVPTFTVTGATNTEVVGSGGTFSLNAFTDGFIFFTSGALAGTGIAVYGNAATVAGSTTFACGPLPVPPSAGDTFYVSANAGNIVTGSGLYPFLYVPAPEQAV